MDSGLEGDITISGPLLSHWLFGSKTLKKEKTELKWVSWYDCRGSKTHHPEHLLHPLHTQTSRLSLHICVCSILETEGGKSRFISGAGLSCSEDVCYFICHELILSIDSTLLQISTALISAYVTHDFVTLLVICDVENIRFSQSRRSAALWRIRGGRSKLQTSTDR